jgi:hypothetical protein
MIWLAHDSEEHAKDSAVVLASLGSHARKLLADSVVTTGVIRKRLSKAAHDLESAGFMFVRDIGDVWEPAFQLTPSLAGEEALQVLEGT